MSGPALSSPRGTQMPIPVGGTAVCDATLYRAADKAAPIVLHLHGGAFVSAPAAGVPCVARLLIDAGATVVSLAYPLAPAHPFPQAIEAAYAALAHLPRAPLFVAGEEAGGNIAAAVASMARDRGEPALAGQILFSPMLDVCVGTASLRHAHAGPVGCRWADGWRQYLPRASDALHPYATPGAAVRLAGLPPTLLVTALDDPMRDEAEAYAERLRGAGVRIERLVMQRPTGFPTAYLDTARDVPWAGPVRQALEHFIFETAQEDSQ